MEELTKLLSDGLQRLELDADAEIQCKLLAYISLLQKWNKIYNLTAIKDEREILVKHILDSLTVYPYITDDLILDVGTGAGLPGIPLAIIFPNKKFVLLDSNGKKIKFLNQVKMVLRVTNIDIIQERIEIFRPDNKFPCVISRAVGPVNRIIKDTTHLLTKNGKLLLMKGKIPVAEINESSSIIDIKQISVPYLDAERCLLIVTK